MDKALVRQQSTFRGHKGTLEEVALTSVVGLVCIKLGHLKWLLLLNSVLSKNVLLIGFRYNCFEIASVFGVFRLECASHKRMALLPLVERAH